MELNVQNRIRYENEWDSSSEKTLVVTVLELRAVNNADEDFLTKFAEQVVAERAKLETVTPK